MSRRGVGTVLGIVLAVTAVAAYERDRHRIREGRDLKPRPDALEYGLGAAALAERGRYALTIAGVDFPPRYPPGFPLLAAPFVAASGGDPSAAATAACAFGVAAAPATALLAHLAAGPVAALAAGLIVALSPAAVDGTVLAMSEGASMLLWALALLAAAAVLWRQPQCARLAPALACGAAIGAALLVRYTNAALLLPPLLLLATRHRLRPGRGALAALLVAVPAAACLAALLAYHAHTFGSPSHDGYRFWVPKLYANRELLFSAAYAFRPLPLFTDGHLAVYGGELLGLRGTLFTPWLALLALLGVVRAALLCRGCAVARLTLLAALVAAPLVFLFHLVYAWQDPRFLLPLLPLAALLAGAGCELVRTFAARALPRPLAAGAALLLAAGLALELELRREPVAADSRRLPPPLVDRLGGLDAAIDPGALVIVNFPTTLAERALGPERDLIVADLASSDPHYNQIADGALVGLDGRRPELRFLARGAQANRRDLAAVAAAVKAGRPVWYLQAAGEGNDGTGVAELRRTFALEEAFARPPLTGYRVRSL